MPSTCVSDSCTAKLLVCWDPLLASRILEHHLNPWGWCPSHMVQAALARRPGFARQKGNASSSLCIGLIATTLTPFALFEALDLGFSNMEDTRLFTTIPSWFHSPRVSHDKIMNPQCRLRYAGLARKTLPSTTRPPRSGIRWESDEFERDFFTLRGIFGRYRLHEVVRLRLPSLRSCTVELHQQVDVFPLFKIDTVDLVSIPPSRISPVFTIVTSSGGTRFR